MVLDAAILLEFLQQATHVPPSSLLETLRFSMAASPGNPRDALWRQVTFEATRALHTFVDVVGEGAVVPADRNLYGGGGVTAGVSGILRPDCLLPTFTSLYDQDAPWHMLFAHNVVTSQVLMKILAGSHPLPKGCGLVEGGGSSSSESVTSAAADGKVKTLHIVIEVDADDPQSHFLFVRRADSAEGGELLQLVVEEIAQLLGPSSQSKIESEVAPASSFACTLEFVLVTTTTGIRNLQSAAQLLFRLVQQLVEAYRVPFSSSDDDCDKKGGADEARRSFRSTLPPKPQFLSHIRVHLADRQAYTFPVLQALFDAPFSPMGSGASSSASPRPAIELAQGKDQQHHVVAWIRDPVSHTELLLQLGHFMYPFVSTAPASSSKPPSSFLLSAPTTWLGLLDAGGVLVSDTTTTKRLLDNKPTTLGTTVTRSVLRYASVDRGDVLHAQLLRQALGISFGGPSEVVLEDAVLPNVELSDTPTPQQRHHHYASRLFPVQSPVVLLKLNGLGGAPVRAITAMSSARRCDMPQLPPSPTPASFVGRLLAFASAFAPPTSMSTSQSQHQPLLSSASVGGSAEDASPKSVRFQEGVAVVGGGVMRLRSNSPYAASPPHEVLLAALRDAVYTHGLLLNNANHMDEPVADTAAAAGSSAPPSGASWSDAVAAFALSPSKLYETFSNDDPLIAPCIRALIAQRNRNDVEGSMSVMFPRPGVLSRVVHTAQDGIDEEEGTPCTIVKRYVQTLGPVYLIAAASGKPQMAARIAEEIEARRSAALAPLSPAVAGGDKKKRSNV